MKKLSILFSVLFAFQTAFGQWNAIGWNPYFVRSTEGDSTFVLSSPSRYDLQRGIANWVPASGAPYKVYTALLTQSGTDAPTATVLENTFSGTVVWSYVSTGTYRATLSGAFTENKTAIPQSKDLTDNTRRTQYNHDGDEVYIGISIISTSIIEMSVVDGGLTPYNNGLTSYLFEIRVYP